MMNKPNRNGQNEGETGGSVKYFAYLVVIGATLQGIFPVTVFVEWKGEMARILGVFAIVWAPIILFFIAGFLLFKTMKTDRVFSLVMMAFIAAMIVESFMLMNLLSPES